MQCFVCKQEKGDVRNYRDDENVEQYLALAYEEIKKLGGFDPINICQQCVNQAMPPPRIPRSQPLRSPDTTVESLEIRILTEGNSQHTNISSESIITKVNREQSPRPTKMTDEEIDIMFKNDPLKCYKLKKLMKKSMPATARDRAYQEIVNMDLSKSQQELEVRNLVREEWIEKGLSKIKRKINISSSSSSASSFSESIERPMVNIPRNAVSQGFITPVVSKTRQDKLTESLTSDDSISSNQGTKSKRPREPSPQYEIAEPPAKQKTPPQRGARAQRGRPKATRAPPASVPPPKQPSPDSSRSSRSSSNEGSAHTNMGAPSRPHIPFPARGTSGTNTRTSKEIYGA